METFHVLSLQCPFHGLALHFYEMVRQSGLTWCDPLCPLIRPSRFHSGTLLQWAKDSKVLFEWWSPRIHVSSLLSASSFSLIMGWLDCPIYGLLLQAPWLNGSQSRLQKIQEVALFFPFSLTMVTFSLIMGWLDCPVYGLNYGMAGLFCLWSAPTASATEL